MPTAPSHPGPRRRCFVIVAALLLLIIASPAAAETVYDDDLIYRADTSLKGTTPAATGAEYYAGEFKNIRLTQIETKQELSYIILDVPYENANTFQDSLPDGEHDLTYTIEGGVAKPCKVYVQTYKNALNQVTNKRFMIFFDEWDIGQNAGTKSIILSQWLWKGAFRAQAPTSPVIVYTTHTSTNKFVCGGFDYVVTSWMEWINHLTVIKDDDGYFDVSLIRNFNNRFHFSKIEFINNGEVVGADSGTINHHSLYAINEINAIKITASNSVFNIPLGSSGTADTTPVTVYIQNSQTGALLADARLSILATAGGTEVEIINETIPGGTGTYTLQPTGGGSPNPDYYRAVATVPGFSQIIENHSFTLNGPHDVIIEMRPDTGGPTDPERCYLEFYVRDLNANPIPSASIQCGNRIKTTNNAGYAIFEVDKNASHSWIAKKSNYVTIEGTATTGPNPRYVVNVVLGPVPTNPPATPTLGPGETPGATPTGWGPGQWTPDPDESLGDNARGAAKQTLLEGLQAGQLLFSLCILVLIMAVLDSRRR